MNHCVFVFSKDLWSTTGSTAEIRSQALGFSYLAGVCNTTRYSISEEIGGFFNIPVFIIQFYVLK